MINKKTELFNKTKQKNDNCDDKNEMIKKNQLSLLNNAWNLLTTNRQRVLI